MHYTDSQLKAAVILLRRQGVSFREIMYFVHEIDSTRRAKVIKQWLIDAGEWQQ